MKKYILSVLIASAAFMGFSHTAAAAYEGQLVKASGAAVYYVNTDGKRFVFPNEATYKTWYTDFSNVVTISDSALANMMIGGNVTYRPGTKLVKITTDPKVYAISTGGALRWVETETIAVSLFGPTWASQVNDIPDAFFINYRVGNPILTASDYAVAQQTSLSSTIAADIILRTPPAIVVETPSLPTTSPTPLLTTPTTTQPTTPTTTSNGVTYQGALSVRETQPMSSGASYTAVALPNPSGGLTSISIQAGSSTVIICDSDYCQPRLTAPVVTATTTQTITGVFTWLGRYRVTTTTDVTIVPRASSNQITFASMTTSVHRGDSRTVEVRIGSEFSATLIRIYMNSLLVKECLNDSICIWSDPELAAVGTQHVFTAQAENREGVMIQSAPTTVTVTAR